jgi:hypothetical protein
MSENAPHLEGTLLARAADYAASRPHLLSWVLARYGEINGLSEEEVREMLGCDRDTYNHLRLCGRPDPDPAGFVIDVQRVAEKLGVDAGLLAAIVRDVDAHAAFTQGNRGTAASPFSSMGGMLKAARDREGSPGDGAEESQEGTTPETTEDDDPGRVPEG